MNRPPAVLIVADHASQRFGGEAVLPWRYFELLRARGAAVHLLVHARTRAELMQAFPGEERIHFIEDSGWHRWLDRCGAQLPARLHYITSGFLLRVAVQWQQRAHARRLVRWYGIEVVHQPMPVSPREPSLLWGVGAAVVIGPMNGAMDFPPGFRGRQPALLSLAVAAGRAAVALLHRLLPGKGRADALVVANRRTAAALPRSRARVHELPENGVQLERWPVTEAPGRQRRITLVYIGRLVDWKAVDLLLLAFRQAARRAPVALNIVGDGSERAALEQFCRDHDLLAAQPGVPGRVFFAGWQAQAGCAAFLAASDALILPSLLECGGAVVLEAMAAARPVIATAWGGPLDYLDASCGLLVEPRDRERFVRALAAAMLHLARSPALRTRLGQGARQRAELFDWQRKLDAMLAIYRDAIDRRRAAAR